MDEQTTPPRQNRTLRWVLGGSLALNLVFVGLFAGAAMRHFGEGDKVRPRGGSVHTFGAPLARSLPREARSVLRQRLRNEVSGLPSRPERQALYVNMLTALRAEPFDVATMTEIFNANGEVAQQMQFTAQETWLSLVSQMSAQERFAVADRLEKALNRPRRKPKKRDVE